MKILSNKQYNDAIEAIDNGTKEIIKLQLKVQELQSELEQWKAKSKAIERDYSILERNLRFNGEDDITG